MYVMCECVGLLQALIWPTKVGSIHFPWKELKHAQGWWTLVCSQCIHPSLERLDWRRNKDKTRSHGVHDNRMGFEEERQNQSGFKSSWPIAQVCNPVTRLDFSFLQHWMPRACLASCYPHNGKYVLEWPELEGGVSFLKSYHISA